jgi:hypothetical protein
MQQKREPVLPGRFAGGSSVRSGLVGENVGRPFHPTGHLRKPLSEPCIEVLDPISLALAQDQYLTVRGEKQARQELSLYAIDAGPERSALVAQDYERVPQVDQVEPLGEVG